MSEGKNKKEVVEQVNMVPDEYKPISMWGYFGYEILFWIPCIGTILLIIFALGGTKNQNLKNFARSYFCIYIILFVLILVLLIILGPTLLGYLNV